MDKSPISELQEIALKLDYTPEYELVKLYNGAAYYFHCSITCKNVRVTAYGRSKKEAKHNGALEMLKKLGEEKVINLSGFDIAIENQSSNTNGSETIRAINYVGWLLTICNRNHLHDPIYDQVGAKGLDCRKIFLVSCSITSTKVIGEGFSKKGARQNAARKMIGHIIGSEIDEDILDYMNRKKEKTTELSIKELEGKMGRNLKFDVIKIPVLMDYDKVISLYKKQTEKKEKLRTSRIQPLSNNHYLARDECCEEDCMKQIALLNSLFIKNTDNVDIDNIIDKISKVLAKPIGPEVLVECNESIYTVGYSIKCLPTIVEMGVGSSLIAAKVAAINKLIRSAIILLQ